YSAILSFMAIFSINRGLENESSFFFLIYAVALILSRPLTGRWFDYYGSNVIIIPSILLFGIGMISLSLSHHVILFFIAASLIGIGWGTLFSCFQTIAIQIVDTRRRAVATA